MTDWYASLPVLIILGLVLIGVGLLMLMPMARYARKIQESPGYWLSLTVLIWGFIWVGYRFISRHLIRGLGEDAPSGFLLLGVLLGIMSVAYGLVWLALRRRGKIRLEERIEEIGEEEGAD